MYGLAVGVPSGPRTRAGGMLCDGAVRALRTGGHEPGTPEARHVAHCMPRRVVHVLGDTLHAKCIDVGTQARRCQYQPSVAGHTGTYSAAATFRPLEEISYGVDGELQTRTETSRQPTNRASVQHAEASSRARAGDARSCAIAKASGSIGFSRRPPAGTGAAHTVMESRC